MNSSILDFKGNGVYEVKVLIFSDKGVSVILSEQYGIKALFIHSPALVLHMQIKPIRSFLGDKTLTSGDWLSQPQTCSK